MNVEDQTNQSCLANSSGYVLFSSSQRRTRKLGWQYNPDGTHSSLTLLPGSLSSNKTYQFRGDLISRQDPSRLYRGYVTVKVQQSDSIPLSFGYVSYISPAPHYHRSSSCILPELCPLLNPYRLINSDTQAAFTSLSSRNLSSNYSIQWHVYSGRMNSSIEWTELENTTQYFDRWFFGKLMSSGTPFRLMKFFFRAECEKLHLQQRSVCQLPDRRVLACSIDLLGRGDERIHFARSEDELPARQRHLFCQSFERNDQHFVHHPLLELDRFRWHQGLLALQSVADSPLALKTHVSVPLVAWTSDRPARSLVGFSVSPSMSVRLSAGDASNSTLVYLSMRVRDPYGCSFEYDMAPVSISRDTTIIKTLVDALQSTSSHSDATHQLHANEIVQILVNGNQNELNQALVSLSQLLNTISTNALASMANISVTALTVSSLDHPWTPVRYVLLMSLITPFFHSP